MNQSRVTEKCARNVGMSASTAASWDPDLWTYPLMNIHEEIAGTIDKEARIEDDGGAIYFAEFDCGCAFYVPSTMLMGSFSDDNLPGDVEHVPDSRPFIQN